MSFLKKIIISSILFFLALNIYSQNRKNIDSLLLLSNETTNKEQKVDLYIELARKMLDVNVDSAKYYAEKSLNLSNQINYSKGIAYSHLSFGSINNIEGSFEKAVYQLMKALSIFKENKDSIGISKSYLKLGLTNYYLNDLEKAQYYNKLSLNFLKKDNYKDLQKVYNNIGLAYKDNTDSALYYFEKSISYSKKYNNYVGLLYGIGNIANLYLTKGELHKAYNSYCEVKDLSFKLRNKKTLIISHCNLSIVLHEIAKNETNRKKKNKFFNKSLLHADSALILAEEMNSLFLKSFAYQQLYIAYENIEDYKNAYLYSKKYILAKDSMFDNSKISEIEKLENKYKSEKQELEIASIKKEKELNEIVINKKNQIILITVIAVIIVLALLVFLLYLYKKKNIANNKLYNQKKSILNQKSEIAAQRDSLSELAFELKKTNKTKNKFISVLAHDLKNPFQSILGFSELIKEQASTKNYANTEKYSGFIFETANETYNLLENLLLWARAQSGIMKYNPENVILSHLIYESIGLVKNAADVKKIKLEAKCDNKILVYVDNSMLSTVLRNLISNAVKFTEKNGTVSVYTENIKDTVKITVKDTGIGIKKEKIPKLFKPAMNSSSYGTENEKGTGLGLSVCKDFIIKNKGEITVKSKPGIGSTFIVTIPKA